MKHCNSKKTNLFLLFIILVATLVGSSCLGYAFTNYVADAQQISSDNLPSDIKDYDHWYFGESNTQMNLNAIRTTIPTWKLEKDKSKINPFVIAVIDSGINMSNPLFNDVLFKYNGKPVFYDTQAQSGQKVKNTIVDRSDKGHGTHVAGIIATQILALGLQDYIKILPIAAQDTGNHFKKNYITDAITWVCGENNLGINADIVNMSFGIEKEIATKFDSTSSWKDITDISELIAKKSKNTVFVAAAGNTKSDLSFKNYTESYPASLPNVVSVMNYTISNELASNSYYGNYDLTAPGTDIYSALTNSGFATKTGTSMAAPFVSMQAALLKVRFSSKTEQQKINRQNNLTSFQIVNVLQEKPIVSYKKGDYVLPFVDLNLSTQALKESDFVIVDPIKIEGLQIEDLTDLNVYDGYKLLRKGQIPEMKLKASLTPEGKYGDLTNSIKWYFVENLLGSNSSKEIQIGTGENLNFLAKDYEGNKNYSIYARVQIGNQIFESAKTKVLVQYADPNHGKIKIVPTNNINYQGNGSDIIAVKGKQFALTLTNIKDIDTSKIKWYVDGKEVETKNNTEFLYTFNEAKVYKIQCKVSNSYLVNSFYLDVSNSVFGKFTVDNKDVTPMPYILLVLSFCGGVSLFIILLFACFKLKKEQQLFGDDNEAEPFEKKKENKKAKKKQVLIDEEKVLDLEEIESEKPKKKKLKKIKKEKENEVEGDIDENKEEIDEPKLKKRKKVDRKPKKVERKSKKEKETKEPEREDENSVAFLDNLDALLKQKEDNDKQ